MRYDGRHYRQRTLAPQVGVLLGIVVVGFGLLWAVLAFLLTDGFSAAAHWVFPAFGLLFALGGATAIYNAVTVTRGLSEREPSPRMPGRPGERHRFCSDCGTRVHGGRYCPGCGRALG